MNDKERKRIKRHRRVRKTVSGNSQRPRLNVFRSLDHIYAQVIDDAEGKTLAAASSLDKELRATTTGGNRGGAEAVGKLIAERAKAAGVTAVRFDRGGYQYHGRVKTLADAARQAGLDF